MNRNTMTYRAEVDMRLAEGYLLWKENSLPELTLSERYLAADAAVKAYKGKYSVDFAAACQCFYLFRKLHGMAEEYPTCATLLGDYFFSQFSKNLIPIDSVPLINAFSRFLASDAQQQTGTGEYLYFIERMSSVMKS